MSIVNGSFDPAQNALNLILNVKQPIAENAANLRAAISQLTPNGLNNVGTVHFARFLFIEDDSKFLVFTSYDGNFVDYVRAFIKETGDMFNALLSFIELPDDVTILPVQDNEEAFVNFVLQNDVKSEAFYSGYPKLTVLNIVG
jgi:hypothetical protein